jgi:signal transduction histidine kinase
MESSNLSSLSELEELKNRIQELEQVQAQLKNENHELVTHNNLLKAEVEQRNLFISLLSHEMRTPLTTVSSYSQHTKEGLQKLYSNFLLGNEEAKIVERALESVTTVLRQTEHMDKMVGDLLSFSRIQNQKLELEYSQQASLDKMVTRVVTQQRQINPQRLIQLQTESEEIRANFDEYRLEGVLNNLLSNALKYSPSNTAVTVGLERRKESDEAVIWVRDGGQGISLEDQTHLFERFYRVNSADKAVVEGLGLGLFISREVIKRHAGRIWVESEVGNGSTFYVTLPLRP